MYFKTDMHITLRGLPGDTVVKESTCQCRRCGFDPWVRKIPRGRACNPTSVSLLGESCGQRSLAGYSPWSHKEPDRTEQLSTHARTHHSHGMKAARNTHREHETTWEGFSGKHHRPGRPPWALKREVDECCSVVPDSLRLRGLHSPCNSPGQNTGVVAFPFSRGSSQLRNRPGVSCVAGGFFTS